MLLMPSFWTTYIRIPSREVRDDAVQHDAIKFFNVMYGVATSSSRLPMSRMNTSLRIHG